MYRDHRNSRGAGDRQQQKDMERYSNRLNERHVVIPPQMRRQLDDSTTNTEKPKIERRSSTTTKEAETAPETTTETSDPKKLERLKKLEAWKKKQQERKKQQEEQEKKKVESPKPVPKVPKLKVKSVTKKPLKIGLAKTVKRTNLFGSLDGEDDGPSKKAFFKPIADDIEEDDDRHGEATEPPIESDADPLDAFMSNLGADPIEQAKKGVGEINDDMDVDQEITEEDSVDEAGNLLKRLKNRKTKDVGAPKFNKKDLEPFQKNFLVEMETIDPDEVINFRVLNNIFINNKKILPVMNFYHFGLDYDALNVITNQLKFTAPTPIQSQTIPAIMSGKDVIGIGKTGSGKTMCYLLGMLKHIKQQRPLSNGETGPLGIILSPTRELAIQIHETCKDFLQSTGLKAICCTGGSELNKQINEIKKGVEIIVATPGRFIDLLTLNNGKLLKTDRITFVTLDEADRLFDLGFEPQINQIMKTIRPDKQCVLFSATFPTKLQTFAVKMLNKPVIIAVGNKQVVNENITQLGKVFENDDEKFIHLLQLLGKQTDEKTIIFCDSQLQVNFMNRRLIEKGYTPVAIHAGLPSHERTANLQKFRKSSNILICTEVLSRGLDVPNVSLVILYNAARTFAQYVHTTGRTARGNKTGTAISLLLKDEELQAYILHKCMVADEVPEDIKELALSFEKDMKDGKKKISSGFGGKGLDNLDKIRDETEKTERKKYGEDDENQEKEDKSDAEDSPEDSTSTKMELTPIPNIDIVFNTKDGRAPDSGMFNAKININDLPQNVRWVASNNTSLSKIIEATSTSITYKGKFYGEGQEPKEGEEPKLFLFIESQKEHQLHEAIDSIKKIIVDELKKANNDRGGKFTI